MTATGSMDGGPVVLYAGLEKSWDDYRDCLAAELARRDVAAQLVLPAGTEPGRVDYIVYHPLGPVQDFSPFSRCKAVLSLWAGAERIVGNTTLTQPLCRMVDESLSRGMVEWVTAQVLRAHLGLDRYIVNPGHDWAPVTPPLAPQRRVTVLGLGTLGAACTAMLAHLGFAVTGWSRSAKQIPGVRCLWGETGLQEALSSAEILVLVLPDTPLTRDLLDAERIGLLPPGACIINPGRGTLIEDAALLAALDSGHVAQATLDVFRTEPLPKDHRYWSHPRVTVSPHVAAETHPWTAAPVLAENIRRGEAGEPLLHLVDRARAY